MSRQLPLAFLVASLALAATCGGSEGDDGSLLDGEIVFQGEAPPLAPLEFVDREGATVIAEPIYSGWISLRTDASLPRDEVSQLIADHGGELIEAIPGIGAYIARVAGGQEATFLGAMYADPRVTSAAPTAAINPAAITVVDLSFGDENMTEDLDCAKHHGTAVARVAGRDGRSVTTVDANASWLEWGGELLSTSVAPRVARRVIKAMEDAHARGERVVVNLSLGVCHVGSSITVIESWCASAERDFLQTLADALQNAPSEIRDNAVVVVAAGNDGVDLTSSLQTVAQKAPAGFERMLVVGASEDIGRSEKTFNHADGNMIYAPAEAVDIDLFTSCSGTSFAAPEVARMADLVWGENPELSSAQLVLAVRQALTASGQPVLPVDKEGLTTRAFVCAVLALATPGSSPCASTGLLAFESGRAQGDVATIDVDVIDRESGERWSVAPGDGFNHELAGVAANGLLVRVDSPVTAGARRIVAFEDWGRGARVEVSAGCSPLATSPGIAVAGVRVSDDGRVVFRADAQVADHPSGSSVPGSIFVYDSAADSCTMLDVDRDGDGSPDDLKGSELGLASSHPSEILFEDFVGSDTALYAVASGGGRARLISADYDRDLSVSAGGSWAAYRDDSDELVAIPINGGAPVRLASIINATPVSIDVGLDPAGRRAAVFGMKGTSFALFLVDLESKTSSTIDVGFSIPLGPAPRFSADGAQLVYTGLDSQSGGMTEGADLFVVPVGGGTPENVTNTADRAEIRPVLR